MELIPAEIFQAYGISQNVQITAIGSGLINRTFLVYDPDLNQKWVLQEINVHVFKKPSIIAENIEKIRSYLKEKAPDYLFPTPIKTLEGNLYVTYEDCVWRLQPYIDNSISLDTIAKPQIAFQAAAQFAKLTHLLKDFPTTELGYPIEQFHDLDLRAQQYQQALLHASEDRKRSAAEEISLANYYKTLSSYYNSYIKRKDFPDRVVHHDTKISNILFKRDSEQALCVIDLDTLMPGKYISDLGDMMRTYLCAFSENEPDIRKINVRIEYFEAVVKGYLSEMGTILTQTEKELLLFSGKYMIYMQAIRFLSDYLNGNIYYKTDYPEQNLDRARNQFALLKDVYTKESLMQSIINKAIK